MKTYSWAVPEPKHRQGSNKMLLTGFLVLLPFIFIGSAFFIVPKFEIIFDEMFSEQKLPQMTELILNTPRITWLFIAALFGWWNYRSSRKENKTILLNLSIIAMLLVSGLIVVALFRPLAIIINQLAI